VDYTPTLDLSMITTDNLFTQPNREKYAVKYIVKPGIHAEAGTNLLKFTGDADFEIGEVQRSHDDDWQDAHLSLGMIYQPTSRARFDAKAGVQFEHDDRGTGFTAGGTNASKSPDEYTQQDVSGKFTYGTPNAKGQLILNAGYMDKEYTNNRQFTRGYDRDEDNYGAMFKWQVAPKTKITLEGRYKDIEYDTTLPGAATLDSDEERYFVGVEWQATYKTSGHFQVGKLYKDFDSSQRKDYDDNAWEAGIQWAPRSYSVVKFDTGRTTSESTGSGDTTATDYYDVSWKHGWRERFSTTARYRHTDDDYPGSNREDDYDMIKLSANYEMRYWLDLEAGYQYSETDSNISAFDYKENQVFLHAKMRF
jgi:hypothetical protein